jgi:ligand-binding SRPBCC domain-containing protein
VRYTRSFTVKAPLAFVAAFHADSEALKKLTPPPIVVQPRRIEPLAEESVSQFVLWLGPLPVPWTARHSQVGPDGFVDEQEKGPYKRWVHHHRFEAISADSSRVIDEIEAELSPQPVRWFIGAALWLGLPVLFAYRAWRTRKAVARMAVEGAA